MTYRLNRRLYDTYLSPHGKKKPLFSNEAELISYLNARLGFCHTQVNLRTGATNIASFNSCITELQVM